jgi:hypothetical protein
MSTKNPHDRFAKDYLEELLSPLGKVTVSREIKDEPNQIDVLFIPYSSPSPLPAPIGLLSNLAGQTAAIEVYRNQPNDKKVRNCLKKLYMYFSELNRKEGKDETDDTDETDEIDDQSGLGKLWIVTTTASENLLNDFGATLDSEVNCPGVYSLHKALKASIIAVNQLPVTGDTLWLRVLGKGGVQKRAVSEFLALPDTHPYKNNTLRMLANLRIIVLKQTDLSEEDREDVMQLSTAYLEWEQKTLQQGEQRGELKGEQNMIIQLLSYRFGEIHSSTVEQVKTLTRTQLTELGKAIFNFSTVTNLQQWLESQLKPVEQE